MNREYIPSRNPSPFRQQLPEQPPENNNEQRHDTDRENIDQELLPTATLDNLKEAQAFIELLKNATLDDEHSALSKETVDAIRNPVTEPLTIDDPSFRLSLDIFLACDKSSEKTYGKMCAAVLRYDPLCEILSYEQVLHRIKIMSGVVPMFHDMCINSCMAYTGPFKSLLVCKYCEEPRYKPSRRPIADDPHANRKPHRQFLSIPVAPQWQAIWRDPTSAKHAAYGWEKVQKAEEEFQRTGKISQYDDVQCGEDYHDLFRRGIIKMHNLIAVYSMDGIQLYRMKKSDTWIGIWTFMPLDPFVRYTKKHVRPALTIPGPNHPKHLDSFIFPSLHHMAALMNEGLPIWDVRDGLIHRSDPFNLYGTADTVGLAHLSGWVGHNGRCGCRFMCGMHGRHKHRAPMYYPAMLKPLNCDDIPSTRHNDYNINDLPQPLAERYRQDLALVLSSRNPTEYKCNRLSTGISKPSIFSGLPRVTPMPHLFPSDGMHRDALNFPQLMISLLRGTIDRDPSNNPSDWP